MKRVNVVLWILMGILVMGIAGCGDSANNDAIEREANATATLMNQSQAAVGMPAIVNWREKKQMKEIYELRDTEGLIRYAYTLTMDGTLIYWGKCFGYGIPYSTQYSNPMTHVYDRRYGATWDFMSAQPEPNGLYPAEGLEATWLTMMDPDTQEPTVAYFEEKLIVLGYPMHESYTGVVLDFSGEMPDTTATE